MSRVKWAKFGADVHRMRSDAELTVRDMAKDYDISPATISRADRGLPVNTETFLVLAYYFLDSNPRAYLR